MDLLRKTLRFHRRRALGSPCASFDKLRTARDHDQPFDELRTRAGSRPVARAGERACLTARPYRAKRAGAIAGLDAGAGRSRKQPRRRRLTGLRGCPVFRTSLGLCPENNTFEYFNNTCRARGRKRAVCSCLEDEGASGGGPSAGSGGLGRKAATAIR